jgi:tripartite-type tricarboxylate transporter receptor subunit TctC
VAAAERLPNARLGQGVSLTAAVGGVFDIALKLVNDRLEPALGSTVVIEHRPGAGGTVAVDSIKTARPDGTTLAMINLSAAANETIVKGKGYDLMADFEPVGQYAWPANVLIVNPSVPAKSVPELIEYLKQHPDTNYSSGGVGSPGNLAGELFKMRTGVKMTHVPYKGAPPAVLAVVTGEVTLMFSTASAAMGQIRGERVRALAVTTPERLGELPDVPTLEQAGLSDFDVSDWLGFIVPKATPLETRERLNKAFVAAFSDPEAQQRLRKAAIIPAAKPLGPAEFDAFLRREIAKWAHVVREAKIGQN